ncbi:MAG: hypothetical protein AAFP86_10405 [Planctomycetota bacterium]
MPRAPRPIPHVTRLRHRAVGRAAALAACALGLASGALGLPAGAQDEEAPAARPSARATIEVRPERFLDAPIEGLPSAEALAVELLDSGPAGTARFLRAFEGAVQDRRSAGADTAALDRLRRLVRDVPRVVRVTLEGADVPGSMRNDAVAVTLEILSRFPGPSTTRRVTDLLAHVDHDGARDLRPLAARLEIFTQVTLDICGSDAGNIVELVNSARPSLATSVLEGVAEARDAQLAAETLVRTLGRYQDFDGLVLNRLERVARRALVHLDARGYDAVRRRLRDPSPFTRREAAFACGSLADAEAVEPLIILLSDPSQSVSTAAHASLRRLTSMTIAADPHRWNLWYDRQQAWWEDGGRVLVESIEVTRRSDLVGIVSEVSTKRLYRDQIAEALEGLLERNDAPTVELAIDALANLRAPRSVPVLERMARSGDALQQSRARAALKALQFAGVDVHARSRPR